MPTLTSLAAPEVVMTTSGAASGDKLALGQITVFSHIDSFPSNLSKIVFTMNRTILKSKSRYRIFCWNRCFHLISTHPHLTFLGICRYIDVSESDHRWFDFSISPIPCEDSVFPMLRYHLNTANAKPCGNYPNARLLSWETKSLFNVRQVAPVVVSDNKVGTRTNIAFQWRIHLCWYETLGQNYRP